VTATVGIGQIAVTSGGVGYDAAPVVTITDAADTVTPDHGASATAQVAVKGAVTAITVTAPGAGYLTPGIKKFVDTLPGEGATNANNLGQYIPVAVPDTTTYPGTDYYEIAVVQYRMKFHSDLPATLLRGYVQLSTGTIPGKQVPLTNAMVSGPDLPIVGYTGVDNPHYLGPTIKATKDRPVRVTFRNLLPTGVNGDLFLPVDTSLMGSGAGPDMMQLDANGVPVDMAGANQGTVLDEVRNPMCGKTPKPSTCFSENRAELHLHGGVTPWISDGTPHQWITPAGENTNYPQGVSVSNVPDMADPGPGAQTFFYTNQESARLMFYHDHSWGITRLNVYAGEEASYLVTDATEQALIGPGAPLAGMGTGTPLIIQDKTFLPSADKVAQQDPTWNSSKWGGEGSLWTPHVYMPAQNPGDAGGLSSFGRWMYGPWFWPPAKNAKYPPIDNPYFDPTCDPNVAAFCEPALIPGTPNVSVGMEAFNDTPVVNGTAYPTTTVDPKAYRYRILNGSNDRFWNLQWYVADPTTGTLSEVALKASEVAAAQTDPVVFPTPDTAISPVGPSWVQIGTEGGFLPAPVVVPNQPITWITDPTRFDVGNVDQHSLLLAPAERADVVVDFSAYRGKTLILYNDAPAAFPARVSSYDYYTGGPDLSPAGAPTTLPGYGPNTRTIMQVKVSNAAPAVAFDRPNTTADKMGALNAAFAHHLDAAGKPAGVFESGSDPIVVGQAAYNSAYGTSFVASGYCNSPSNAAARCDGFSRIAEQGGDLFKFDTLNGTQMSIPLQGKGIHDEMNSASFDEWGRMTANLGLEAPGVTPLTQNIILYPYVNPATEILDSTGLPPGLKVTKISNEADGTQIWKITHNGVDTHPLHFHLFNVQVLNRVTWDGIIIPPDATELGWKDTVRVSPLEDTIVAMRPIVPTLPFAVPDSIRPLNPMMPLGAHGNANGILGTEAGFNNTDTSGNPIAPIVNEMTNFGWEYVIHCHILSHEEMDMMRPMTVHVAWNMPSAPTGVGFSRTAQPRGGVNLTWVDPTPVSYTDTSTWGNMANEIGFRIERAVVDNNNVVGAYTKVGNSPANSTNFTDIPADATLTYSYRVVAWNVKGEMASAPITVLSGAPAAPTALTASVVLSASQPAGAQVELAWTNTAATATSVVVERATGNGAFGVVATLAADAQSYIDAPAVAGTYSYRVHTANASGDSANAGPVAATVNKVASTTALVVTPTAAYVGDNVTFTATVSGAGASSIPSGTVTFAVNAVAGAPVALVNGVATFSTTTLPYGLNTNVTATYNGDAVFLTSTDTKTVAIDNVATDTVLTSSKLPSSFGENVVFTATVTKRQGGAPAVGSVTFTVAGTTTAPVALDVNGVASVNTNALPVGLTTVTAVYSGNAPFLASSGTLDQTVNKSGTATVLTSSGNSSLVEQNVTFTATVSSATAPGAATGSVEFRDGATVLGTSVLNASGVATFSTATLPAGPHAITAAYLGDAVRLTSSATLTQVVNKWGTVTTVTSNRTPSTTYGRTVTLNARVVRAVPNGPGLPTGSIEFRDGTTVLGTVAVDATGRAAFTITTPLAVGSHALTAVYLSDAVFGSSTGSVTQAITKATSATVVTSNRQPSVFGQSVTFTARVTGTVVPDGTVQFMVDGVASGAPVTLDATGRATLALSTLTVGNHAVVAQYLGSPNFLASNSATLTQTVNRAASRTVVTTSGTPANAGTNVTFTATVSAVAPGAGVPATGTIVFTIDGVAVSGPVTLTAGTATYSTSTLTIGTHVVSARYAGGTNFTASTSATLSQRIR
ncbi:MAG: hypothetical protein RLZZ623_1749, partial [Actinomycetota bacterium]